MLGELLPQRQVVVATGGGTFAEADNRALMLADGAVAWLDVPLAQVLKRVPTDGRRPLAADRAAMEQLFQRRQLAYAEAHVRIDSRQARPRSGRAPAGVDRLLMRYLVLSDVHANLEALDAVLAPPTGEWDQVLVLGDLVGYGADPNAVVERVRDAAGRGAWSAATTTRWPAGLAPVDSFNHVARQAIEWTARGAHAGQPASGWRRCRRGRSSIDELIEICHGAPFDEDVYVFDELDVERAQPVADARRSACSATRTCRASSGSARGARACCRCAASAAACRSRATGAVPRELRRRGQPRDGDPRAAFGLLDADARALTIVRVAVRRRDARRRRSSPPACRPVLAQRLAHGALTPGP